MNIATLKNNLTNYIQNNYGQINPKSNLEHKCDKSNNCWENYRNFSTGENQKPYIPWIGNSYDGLLFLGINFNGGNNIINYPEKLKEIAVNEYLQKDKYLIFRQEGYRGSPYWYYCPLIAFIYSNYFNTKKVITNEEDISFENIISGFNFCSMTNLIKCSTSNNDRSSPNSIMFENCIQKTVGEIKILNPKIIFSFTLYNHPEMIEIMKDYFRIGPNESVTSDRTRITQFGDFIFVELEHPLSTVTNRRDKFESYSKALYTVLGNSNL
jgi:hypothetical protein